MFGIKTSGPAPHLSTPPTQPPHGDACVLVLLAHELGAARRRRRRLGHHGLRAAWVVSLHRALVAGPEPVAVRPLPALAHQRVVGSPQAVRPVARRVAQGVVPAAPEVRFGWKGQRVGTAKWGRRTAT